jgi:hypothetical protein
MGFESSFRCFPVEFSTVKADVERAGIDTEMLDAAKILRCRMPRRCGRTVGHRRSTRRRYELLLVVDWPGSRFLYDESRGVARVRGTDAAVAVRCSITSIGMEHVGQSQEVGGVTARSATARFSLAC